MNQPRWGQSRSVDGVVQVWSDDGLGGCWTTTSTPTKTPKACRDAWAVARMMMATPRLTRRPPAHRATRTSRATTRNRTAAHRASRKAPSSGSSSGESGEPGEPPPPHPRFALCVERPATAQIEVAR